MKTNDEFFHQLTNKADLRKLGHELIMTQKTQTLDSSHGSNNRSNERNHQSHRKHQNQKTHVIKKK